MPESLSAMDADNTFFNSDAAVFRRTNLTTSQFLMWMGQHLHPEAPLYNMVYTFAVRGALDPDHFQHAFQALLDRSDALRTVVEERGGVPVQRVQPPFAYRVAQVDLAAQADPEAAVQTWIAARCARPLALRTALFDAALLRLAPEQYVWYLNQHHLVTDIWSTALLYKHVAAYYGLSQAGRLHEAPDLPAYARYVEHERAFLASPRFEAVAAYWQKQREALPPATGLYGRQATRESIRTERVRLDLGAPRSARLRALAQTAEVRALTPHLTFFSIFAALLFAYLRRVSGQEHLAIGTPVHNRPTVDFKETIGLFIEVFPFQVDLNGAPSFVSLIKTVQREALTFFRHAQPGISSAAANRSYTVLLNYLHAAFPSDFAGMPMTSDWMHSGYGDSRHHLRLQVQGAQATGSFHLYFDFNAALFDALKREAAVAHFLRLLDAFLDDPAQSVTAPSLTDGAEQRRLLACGRAASPTHEEAANVVSLFEAQAARTPAATAVTGGDQALSFRDLDARANRLAHYLRVRGVGPEVCVGLCVARSLEAVVAVLGVLKAGGAYMPMDPHYPAARLAFMLHDAQATVVITDDAGADRMPTPASVVVHLGADAAAIAQASADPLPDPPAPDQAAYVIYTSGSTGRPKGVVVEHQSLAGYVAWAAQYYFGRRPVDLPLFTPLAVDLTVTSLYVPLVTGGQVVVYGEDPNPARILERIVRDDAVDAIKLTPSHCALLQHLEASPGRVRTLILGGEDLKTSLARRMKVVFDKAVTIYNEYGPTEATVGCTVHRFDPARDTGESVPIGGPVGQARVYVLDEALNAVPEGVTGMLYVAGPGLARGYLYRPELTAERFGPDPFHPGGRLYRTGDLARWTTGASPESLVLAYLGRADHQVKVRGARVELGDVEAALLEHPAVEDAVATVVSFAQQHDEVTYCVRCGLPSNYPGALYTAEGVCHLCRAYDRYAARAQRYFGSMDDLRARFEQVRGTAEPPGGYDCLMLLSGGKDSTYALARLVDLGLRVLAFTLDNGYIAAEAKANIRRVTEALGVDHVFGETPAMNAIFADSLQRFSNVCNGCFKTIYTLGLQLARKEGIPIIVTGLSRGQFFETRLTEELFLDETIDADRIDAVILEARKAYHRVDDAVFRLLDVDALQEDAVFEQIQFVDFYRYCDVSLEEMLVYLDARLPWVRPSDTGRSTNCLINDAGIFVHKKERGFHNYAFPYSWDVRVGHKTRTAALEELDDDIDEARVRGMLREIGYDSEALHEDRREHRLAAYYTGADGLTASELRAFIADRLPAYMVPSYWVRLDAVPLNPTGKVDRGALPHPEMQRPDLEHAYVAPGTDAERVLARLWAEVLRLQDVGIHDNFFDLGGESILAIQISARASQAGLSVPPGLIFQHQTIAELAAAARPAAPTQAEQGLVTGEVPLTPAQHWFFDHEQPDPQHWNHAWLLETTESLDAPALNQAIEALLRHHDALRMRYFSGSSGWRQMLRGAPDVALVDYLTLAALPAEAQDRAIQEHETALHDGLDLEAGSLVRLAYFALGPARPDRLLFVVHHLAVDGVSWPILLDDLETAYQQAAGGHAIALPPKTTSYKAWADALTAQAQSEAVRAEASYWRRALGGPVDRLPLDHAVARRFREADTSTLTVALPTGATTTLLEAVPGAFHARINEALLAALAAALRTWVGVSALRVDTEGHGRETLGGGEDVSRTVGWFTAFIPVVLDLQPDDPVALLRSVKGRWRALPGRGLGYGLLRYVSDDPEIADALAALPPADVLFNYLGRLDPRAPSDERLLYPIRPLRLSRSPRLHRSYALEVNTYVDGGQLHAHWSYSPLLHRDATMQRAADAFVEALSTLVARHRQPDTAGVTPSDFPLAGLDDGKLDKIAALLRTADRASNNR